MEKTITYDHGDYRAELDGQLIGFFKTYHDAETELNRVAFDWLIHGNLATATELDGDAEPPVLDPLPEQPGDQYPGVDYEEERAPSLSQAIAIGLVGDPDPTCEHCGATAFVWCDGHMYCRSWWHTGVCQISTADWDEAPDLAVLA